MFRLSATLVRYRTASVAKFHGRARRLFADENRLRITSAAGADARMMSRGAVSLRILNYLLFCQA